MNWEISFADMCRACMKVDGNLLSMYDDANDAIRQKNLPDKLSDLTSIQIDRFDGLPTMLCPKCAYRTDAFYDFKLQVQATEKKLREMFNKQIRHTERDENSEDENLDWNSELKHKVPERELIINDEEEAGELLQIQLTNENIVLDNGTDMSEFRGFIVSKLPEDKSVVHECKQLKTDGFSDEDQKIFDYQHSDYTIMYIPENISLEIDNDNDDENSLPYIQKMKMEDEKRFNFFVVPQEFHSLQKTELTNDFKPSREIKIEEFPCNFDPAGEMLVMVEDGSTDVSRIKREKKGGKRAELITKTKINLREATQFKDRRRGENNQGVAIRQKIGSSPSKVVENRATNQLEIACSVNKDESKFDDRLKSNNSFEEQEGEGEEEVVVIKKEETYLKVTTDEDSSDSDYFVDPKDNILGSLNDAITRIKEIKLDDNRLNYQCTLCLQNYEKLTEVLLHTIDNHVPGSGPFFCVVCEKDCESHKELRSHVKIHTGRFPYSCFICNKAYSMKRYLKRHMMCHADFLRHRCPKCGLRFNAKTELSEHVAATHVQGAPFACSQCPRSFNHKGNYKRHLISHLDPQGLHLPKYPCQVCGKRFLNNRTLETHLRVHTGEKPFRCEVCGRSFSQQGNLLNHTRNHSNPRSYTCEVCGKRFNQKATLRDHSLLHTGEKPYVCNVCGIAFTFSAALRRHMWTHTGGKPFGCEICKARFVGKYDLRRHMRIHAADKPTVKKKKPTSKENPHKQQETVATEDTQTGLEIEQAILSEDVVRVVVNQQQESEKENVDALLDLIRYSG